jgi:hypothetical protein
MNFLLSPSRNFLLFAMVRKSNRLKPPMDSCILSTAAAKGVAAQQTQSSNQKCLLTDVLGKAKVPAAPPRVPPMLAHKILLRKDERNKRMKQGMNE